MLQVEYLISQYDKGQEAGFTSAYSVFVIMRHLVSSKNSDFYISKNEENLIHNFASSVADDEEASDDLKLCEKLIEIYRLLDDSSNVKKVFEHIIRDIGSRYYNLRESSLITPDAFFSVYR